ncbi:DHA2 family efflux MFS transporter permease subunit [Streptomyces longispororuber]|uniref:DHA2 family efflux MFS transporter permease subunit n=1 Tax=Streptomyces longispororuber TaxID=68230 RepID=UPI0036F6C4C7
MRTPNPAVTTPAVTASAATAPAVPALDARRRRAVLAICALSMFLVGLDTTIVNVGLPAIGDGLGTGTRHLEWIVDAYTIVLASLLTTSGALADRFGRRRVFQLGLGVFGVASLACALAPSAGALIAARAVQGVGASMLSPVALAIVVNATPDARERARAIGVWAAVFGLSMAAGPVTGGALLAVLDWRALFWVNVPVLVAALVLSALFVPESRAPRHRSLDVPGQALLMLVVGLTVAILIEGPHRGWTAPLTVAGYAAVTASAVAFAAVERRRREPLMDLSLFRAPAFGAAVLGATAVFTALNLTLLLNTYYLQHARGLSALIAGCATLPMALAATVCAPVAGAMVGRHGPRRPLLIAAASLTAGALALVGLSDSTPLALLLGAYLVIGVGVGFANAPLTNTAVGGLPRERAGVAGAITSTARQVGAAVGVAVAGGLVAGQDPARLAQASHPGWLTAAACGAALFLVACTARPAA